MKIIQIAVSCAPACQGEHGWWESIYALTDDGRLFCINTPHHVGAEWQEMPLPKDAPPNKNDVE